MNRKPKVVSPPMSPSHSSIPNSQSHKPISLMARKSSFLRQTLIVLAFFILAVYAFVNTFFSPPVAADSDTIRSDDDPSSFNKLSHQYGNFDSRSSKVKIYMYNLPRKFNYGIIEQHAMARGSSVAPVDDVSMLKYPGHQHMGEWYLFSDLTPTESVRVGSPIVKVTDPDEADLFYVPVFSSLSLVVNVGGPAVVHRYSDEEMQEEIVEWLEQQEYWRRNNGRDHVIIAGDPNAMLRVMDRIKNAVLLVSDFGRLTNDQGSLVKDVVIPYSHRINAYMGDPRVDNRNILLFFMGNRYRKEGGKIRNLLFDILETEEDVVIKHGTQSRENRRAATQGMHSSKFCLNPAGDTPSACRLFDAIVSLCVPVIVSDSIELPFEDVIDYRKIAVFVETSAALNPGFLVSTLRAVTPDRILEYQRELKGVQRYFLYEHPNGAVNQIWREVSQKLPLVKIMINRDNRLVRRESSEPVCSFLCTNQTGIITSL